MFVYFGEKYEEEKKKKKRKFDQTSLQPHYTNNPLQHTDISSTNHG